MSKNVDEKVHFLAKCSVGDPVSPLLLFTFR